MRKVLVIALVLMLCVTYPAYAARRVPSYYYVGGVRVPAFEGLEAAVYIDLGRYGVEDIAMYDASDLTEEILKNRDGTFVVERCIGMVTDAQKGDGVILNGSKDGKNYISYRSVDLPYSNDAIMLSYIVYDPYVEHIDSILMRYDYVLKP